MTNLPNYVRAINKKISGMELKRARVLLKQSEIMGRIVGEEIDECLKILGDSSKIKGVAINNFVVELRKLISKLLRLDERGIKITNNLLNLEQKEIPVGEIKKLLEKEREITIIVGVKEKKIRGILLSCDNYLDNYNEKDPNQLKNVSKFAYHVFKYLLPLVVTIIDCLKKYIALEEEKEDELAA